MVPSLVLTAQLKFTANDRGVGLALSYWPKAHVVLKVHNFGGVRLVELHRYFLWYRYNDQGLA